LKASLELITNDFEALATENKTRTKRCANFDNGNDLIVLEILLMMICLISHEKLKQEYQELVEQGTVVVKTKPVKSKGKVVKGNKRKLKMARHEEDDDGVVDNQNVQVIS
jgi:hypothetical protein